MEGDKKEGAAEKKRKSAGRNAQSPSRSSRAAPSATEPTSPRKSKKPDGATQDSTWVAASVKSPRGGKRLDATDEDGDLFHFDQDDDGQHNFFTTTANGFLKYYERRQFCDCIVVAGSERTEYHAHKLILAYSSQYFYEAFKSPDNGGNPDLPNSDSEKRLMIGTRDEREAILESRASSLTAESSDTHISAKENAINDATTTLPNSKTPSVVIVQLPWLDTSENIFPSILHYMYTGNIQLSAQNCVLVSAVAESLQMPSLQTLCKDYIAASLQRENAVELLLEATKYKAQNLLKRSISNVARNFCHIQPNNVTKLNYNMFLKVLAQESLVVTDEYHLYRVVCAYCDVHKDILSKANILRLMSHVRFRWLTYEQFVEVSKNPLVPKPLIIEAAMARLIPHELPADEATKKTAALPVHLQQRPKFSILFEFTPPKDISSTAASSVSSSSILTTSGSNVITAGGSGAAAPSGSSQPALSSSQQLPTGGATQSQQQSANGGFQAMPVNALLNPLSNQPDLATVLASSSNSLSSSSVVYPDIFNGIIGWIATNSAREPWRNAHVAGRVKVHSSSLAKGSRATLVDKAPSETWTNDIPCSWISIDLGPYRKVTPTYYTLRHGLNYKADSLRTWDLQGSTDGVNWKTIKRHANDRSLNAPFAHASWPIPGPVEGYRFFRILQNGHNSSNHNFLALSGFEFYGWLDVTV